jgi:CheY-like chemotaxis protein
MRDLGRIVFPALPGSVKGRVSPAEGNTVLTWASYAALLVGFGVRMVCAALAAPWDSVFAWISAAVTAVTVVLFGRWYYRGEGSDPAPPVVRPRTLVVVEDDPALAHLLCAQLQLIAPGDRVIGARSLKEARLAIQFDPDLILLDLMLPDGEGIELIAEAKARSPAPRVVVVTGLTAGPKPEAARAAGADLVLTKPVTVEDLVRLVDGTSKRAGR